MSRKKPYGKWPERITTENSTADEDIIDLGDIATLQPTKNAQIAAKKISEKYKNIRAKKRIQANDDIDFKITDSHLFNNGDDEVDFTVTDSQVDNDNSNIDFGTFDLRVVNDPEDDIDFSITDSRVLDDNDIDFSVTDSNVVDNESDIDFNVTDSRIVTNQHAKAAAKRIKKKYKDMRERKAWKLLKIVALKEKNNIETKDPPSKKSAVLAAKKISDKYRKIRKHKNVDLVAEVQQTLTNKNVRIAAKKISKKYKKMRNKRAPIPFHLNTLATMTTQT